MRKEDKLIHYWAHMLDEAFNKDIICKKHNVVSESYSEFSGVDFSKSIPWTKKENDLAKKVFNTTEAPFSYGYILPDGTRLDFEKPIKVKVNDFMPDDHCQIFRVFSEKRLKNLVDRIQKTGTPVYDIDDIYEEIKYEAVGAGLIRLYKSNNAYMIHVIQKPTNAQMDALYDIRDGVEECSFDQLELMLPNRGLVSYTSPKDFELKFMNDIRNEF